MNTPADHQEGGAFVALPSSGPAFTEAMLNLKPPGSSLPGHGRAVLRDALHLTGQLLEAIDRAGLAVATPDFQDAVKFARVEHARLLGELNASRGVNRA